MQETIFQNTIPFLFNRLANSFRNYLEKQLQNLNLHGGQVFVLIELWQTDGLSQIKLAENLRLSSPTIHKMVRSLTEQGFTVCQTCSADNRLKRVYLTDLGKQIKPDLEIIWKALEDDLIGSLSETEQLIFRQLLQNLIQTSFQSGSKLLS